MLHTVTPLYLLLHYAHPDGIKKRRRTLIAALPRKHKEFLDDELARNPQLLDHEPRFLDDLAVLTEDYYPLSEEALYSTVLIVRTVRRALCVTQIFAEFEPRFLSLSVI